MPHSLRPRALGTALLLALGLATPGLAGRVDDLVDAVSARARFAPPLTATGTAVHVTSGGERTSVEFRLVARRGTTRIEVDGGTRALVRRGKALVIGTDETPRLTLDAPLGSTPILLGDLGVFTSRLLQTPQIADEGPTGIVVAGAPRPASPYALLVYTVDPERRVVTQVKYYRWSINNLVKRERRSDFVDVAGQLRPQTIVVSDVVGGGTVELSLTWRDAAVAPARTFTARGLAEVSAP